MKPQAPAILLLTVFLALSAFGQERRAVIRTNQLGYLPGATKVAVYLGPAPAPEEFRVVNVFSGEPVFRAKPFPRALWGRWRPPPGSISPRS